MLDPIDCGDNSCLCVPPEKRTGMRTNGGCYCFKNLKLEDRIKVRHAITYWKQRALAAESVITIKRESE